MNLIFSEQAWEDYLYWQETDKRMVRRIHELLKDIRRHPLKASASLSRCGMRCVVIGPAVWMPSTGWFTGFPRLGFSWPRCGIITKISLSCTFHAPS